MKKPRFVFILFILLLWSCATTPPPPPTFYIENLPPSLISELTLDERILVEDAWKSLKKGDGNKAKKIISKFQSDSPVYKAGLGYAYYILNELETAERLLKEALTEHPDMILIHMGLAQIYQENKREDLAFNEYREVLKREPEHLWAKSRYENIKNKKTEENLLNAEDQLAQGNTEKGKEAYLRALYYSPSSVETHFALAVLYKKENEIQNALVHFKAASSYAPQDREILKPYGEILFETENYKASLDVYEKLLELEPGNQEYMNKLQTIKNRLGIFELPSQYETISLKAAVSKEDLAALIAVKFKDILDDPTENPPIIIDISTSWASKFILKMTTLGILGIYPNHTFQPKKSISKAEMAEALYHLIEQLKKKGYRFIQQIPRERIQIQDVSSDNLYYQPILSLISYDIMILSQDKTFKPDSPVSGKEAVKYLDIILALIG